MAGEIANDWEALASRMNITPSSVKTQLPAGSTPYDCATKLFEMLAKNATTVVQLSDALRRCGNVRVARMIEAEDERAAVLSPTESIGEFKARIYGKLTYENKCAVLLSCNLPHGTVDRVARNGGCADFFGAISNQNYMNESAIDISIWSTMPAIVEEMMAFARKYDLQVRGQVVKSQPVFVREQRNSSFDMQSDTMAEDDPLAAALAAKTNASKTQTIAEFVNSPALAHWRTKICLATDENCNFVRLLTNMGLISQPGMSKFVGDLKAKWNADRTGEPTMTVLKSLARNAQFADKPLESLFKTFEGLKVKEINTAIAEYRRHRDGKTKSANDRNNASFESEDDMRQFLLSTNFSNDETIDDDMETIRDAGVETIQDLYEFEESDFKDAFGKKFKPARMRKFINLIKRTKSASSSTSTSTTAGAQDVETERDTEDQPLF